MKSKERSEMQKDLLTANLRKSFQNQAEAEEAEEAEVAVAKVAVAKVAKVAKAARVAKGAKVVWRVLVRS